MNNLKHTTQLTIFVAIVLLLVGCGSGGAFEGDTNGSNNADSNSSGSNQVTVDPEARIYEIIIDTGNKEIYSSLQYKVTGKYDDGNEQDVTKLVKFEVTNNIVSFDDEGVAMPNTIGTTEVTATLNGVTSDPVTLDVIETLVCGHTTGNPLDKNLGGGIDDDSRSTASGECLKIREVLDSDDPAGPTYKWFTSSPSTALIAKLGYSIQDNSTNTGDSYATSNYEDGNNGPAGYHFASFRQDGDGAVPPSSTGSSNRDAGKDGQAYRWCQKLNTLEFAGKTGWHIPSISELNSLNKYQKTAGSMYDRFGWPATLDYHTWVSGFSKFDSVQLHDSSNPLLVTADEARYVSCVVDL
ncbi:hypothetical protein GTG28_05315 [Vibrio sp. OCN044]|uniref:BIG2 domain-containing protein n=1 Tax=Vibrio tetraodonis subsp. pristinus TaxID=2695891 RepID=A0A6L8LTW3_9VIBR|nr:DUF1566 domain-containing protein [Vibrio tetraodonis]MYM58636.1 hypothetical protein [Vibrio tetraodonis subsp. pristinus]